jgi:hypothetical protein
MPDPTKKKSGEQLNREAYQKSLLQARKELAQEYVQKNMKDVTDSALWNLPGNLYMGIPKYSVNLAKGAFNTMKHQAKMLGLAQTDNIITEGVDFMEKKYNVKPQTQYADGGNLTRFNEGGTHEQNPLGGIPQGQDAQGNMNTVEQGETKSGNFVYSDRITLDSSRVKQFNLPGYAANKSVSAASKAIEDKFKDRNDKYASETKKALLDRLANAQESVKAEQDQTKQAMQANSEQAPEDMMQGQIPEGMEEFVQPEESQPMAVYGGMQKKYNDGGYIQGDANLDGKVDASDVPGEDGMTGSQITAGVTNGLGTALALGQTAFGKAAQDTSGAYASNRVGGVSMIGGSAVKGAAAGAAFGPVGAAIGGGVGLIAGVAGLGKARKAEVLNNERFQANNNRMRFENYAANGGNLNIYKYANGGLIDPPVKPTINPQSLNGISTTPISDDMRFNTKPIVRYQPGVMNDKMGSGFYLYSKNVTDPGFDVNKDREFVKQSEMMTVQRTPEWANYMKGQTKFKKGGNLKPVSELTPTGLVTSKNEAMLPTSIPLDIQNPYDSNPYLDKAKLIGKDVSKFVGDNAGEALRYAPIAANLLQMKNLKKPTGVQYKTLNNKYKPLYIDEAQGRNIVDAESNNAISAISQSGASQGAIRNSILGASLNRTKALSDVYANSSAQNRAQDAQKQQFDANIDQSNAATANKTIDENRMDDSAYRSAKSKMIASLGNSAGAIGKEIADSQLASALTGYTRKGKYLYKPDGTKVTPEQISKLKSVTESTLPTLKKGDKYTDENGKVQTFKYGGYLNTKRNK